MNDDAQTPAKGAHANGSYGIAGCPLHPFLLALFSVAAPYAANLRETVYSDVIVPAAAVMALAAAALLIIGALARRFAPRVYVIASIILIGGLFYADILDRLYRWGVVLPPGVQLAAVLAGVAVLVAVVTLVPFRLVLANALLNGVAAVLFVVPAWEAASYELSAHREPSATEAQAFAADDAMPKEAAQLSNGQAPNILYIIFDRFASESTLRRVFGFDNSEFTAFLRREGFFVAQHSVSNYLKTAPSIASSLNLDYINYLAGEERSKRSDWHPIFDMLDDHRAARFLKARGYRYVQVGGWWGPTQHNRFADENHSFGFTEFEWLYLQRTILPRILNVVAPQSTASRRMQWDNAQCQRVPLQIAALKDAGSRPERTFTFAHVLLPHEPFVFDADGRCMPIEESWARGFDGGYVGQIRYADRLIEDLVSSLLDHGGTKPIIIIQADEGPFPERYRLGDPDWREATPDELHMKTGILNAYFFPDQDYSTLRDDITPVNSFRVVFNKYFGASYDLLPEHVFAFPNNAHLYDFFDITDVVRGGPD